MLSDTLCRLCGFKSEYIFSGKIYGNQIKYYECPDCGYVQTEEPYWLEQSYSSAINITDTGIMARNLTNRNIVIMTMLGCGKSNIRVVDFAGGYGILVRLLRDAGVDAYWKDMYCDNLLSRGFEYTDNINNVFLCTAFEVFEHLVKPCDAIEEMFRISPNILFSTEIIHGKTPALKDWSYYGLNHGQHIGFYKIKTLEYLSKKYNKILISNGKSYHMLCDKEPGKVFENLFKLSVRYSNIFSLFVPYLFESKTMSDHEYLFYN